MCRIFSRHRHLSSLSACVCSSCVTRAGGSQQRCCGGHKHWSRCSPLALPPPRHPLLAHMAEDECPGSLLDNRGASRGSLSEPTQISTAAVLSLAAEVTRSTASPTVHKCCALQARGRERSVDDASGRSFSSACAECLASAILSSQAPPTRGRNLRPPREWRVMTASPSHVG